MFRKRRTLKSLKQVKNAFQTDMEPAEDKREGQLRKP